MTAFYNEIDEYAAAWLRNLIAARHIAPGVVDTRSIEDIRPSELAGYAQCHFFAGIGVWSLALRRAGWPDDRPVWTGSCPCQPFSQAGEGAGFSDERHLWPAFHWLIGERRPAVVLGEQVASKDANAWIDLVQADLEGLGFAFGAIAFPAAGIGAPHIRDRTYWVGHADSGPGREGRAHLRGRIAGGHAQPRPRPGRAGVLDRLAHNHQHGRRAVSLDRGDHAQHHAEPRGESGGLGHAYAERAGRDRRAVLGQVQGEDRQHLPGDAGAPGADGRMEHPGHNHDAGEVQAASAGQPEAHGPADQPGGSGLSLGPGPGPINGHWAAADWLLCRDARWRPVEPGAFPLAHGAPARVGRLRAYGNAIVAPQAQTFIEAVMESAP